MPDDEVAARIEMRVENNGQRYTLGAFDGSYGEHQQGQRIGYVSQFGDVSKYVVMTRIEGTTGMTGASQGASMLWLRVLPSNKASVYVFFSHILLLK